MVNNILNWLTISVNDHFENCVSSYLAVETSWVCGPFQRLHGPLGSPQFGNHCPKGILRLRLAETTPLAYQAPVHPDFNLA
jgi:hypothetical protein